MESKEKEKIKRIAMACFEDEVDPEIEWKRLLQKINVKTQPYLSYRKSRFITFLKYGAAIVSGILLSFPIRGLIKGEEPERTSVHYKLHTDKGEKSSIELPDGTRIRLNSYTTVEYNPSYGIDNRTVYLKGEAYFDVAKDKDLPFLVKADGVEIKAVGTSFNVSAYSEDTQLVTTLYSGQVVVRSTSTQEETFLEPNQIAVYDKRRSLIEKRFCNECLNTQWHKGSLTFEMMSLQDITKILERNYDVIFCYKSHTAKDLRFSGGFRDHETIQEIMKVIKTNTSINYQIKKDTIFIK
ncbi:FecR family protein [Parabacteroides sp. Marseille-P3160]|uniref:FecR family protein n=1 Tax=Parabacteroides sp. Marseille-P3160 TaxID=1917887 RepID=UPI001F2DFDAB|nr:FecR domain-containing protein [Parabacteroides sp. Marseille-P3160]